MKVNQPHRPSAKHTLKLQPAPPNLSEELKWENSSHNAWKMLSIGCGATEVSFAAGGRAGVDRNTLENCRVSIKAKRTHIPQDPAVRFLHTYLPPKKRGVRSPKDMIENVHSSIHARVEWMTRWSISPLEYIPPIPGGIPWGNENAWFTTMP